MVGILQDTVIMTYSNLKYTTVVTLKLVSGIVQWVDNYTKDYMSMLDLYEAATIHGQIYVVPRPPVLCINMWVSLISPQVRLHLLYLVDLRKITNNCGSDLCATSFVDVDVQFEGFNANDEYKENKSVEVVGDTIEGIDEEVTDSEKEEDGNGVTLKFKDYDYKQSEEDDDKGAKNVEANDTLFDQIVAGDTIKETHKELGDISIKEYNS
ncbi:hypothetical protein ACFX10_030737 [Malus domestica]